VIPNQGLARYNGSSELVVQQGDDVFELTADVELNLNLEFRQDVQIRITNLEGTKFPALGPQEAVSLDGEIRISEITRDDTALSGGEFDIVGTPFAVTYQAETDLNGQFFGPNGEEVGATFVIDNVGTNATLIMGDILAEQQ